jgi:hypothetical protein
MLFQSQVENRRLLAESAANQQRAIASRLKPPHSGLLARADRNFV